MSKPYYHRDTGAVAKADTVEWTPVREEDAWFIAKREPKACACGAACPGDWTAGTHHGVHKCARVITSINGHKRLEI